METTRERGRPPKDEADRRDTLLKIKTTADERALLDEAAGDEPVSVWARETLLRAARRRLG